MKIFIVSLSILCVVGCGEVIYYKEELPEFNIISYTEITEEQISISQEMLTVSKEFLRQEKVNKKFTIKIVYNRTAFKELQSKNGDSNAVAFYAHRNNMIVLKHYNFTRGNIAHEMVHAIIDVNNLKTSDGHSLAYQLSDRLDTEDSK